MKLIITESQAKLILNEKIKCQCGHSWKKEPEDKDPYLCHICGWDSKKKKYFDDKLIEFWNTYKNE